MRAHIGMATAVLVLLGSGNVWATIIELPLDGAGTYGIENPRWESSFDLGVEFTDISHVFIDWEGQITAGQAIKSDNPNNPFPMYVGLSTYIGDYISNRYTSVWGGASTYPEPEPYDLILELEYGTMPWSELYYGKGTIVIYYNHAIILNGKYIEPGFITLNSAKLLVEGNLVPEPTTIYIMTAGGIVLLGRRKKLLHIT